ncbi:MAG: hypothetical protein A2Z25_00305 [Planctomycetes bacterium RBG_16_55_9]|nr:MAG: hypothetical protein A2Z25_00305 [Planctomycetes bacterium RBG_16_55_9]
MGFTIRDQIPPLRVAAQHSGRNDKIQPCLFPRRIDVFFHSSEEWQPQAKLGDGFSPAIPKACGFEP